MLENFERLASSSYVYPICSFPILYCLLSLGSKTISVSVCSSNTHDNGIPRASLILDRVATAVDVCLFSIFDIRLFVISHLSAICCCVFFCLNRACLIFFPICCKSIIIRSLHFYKCFYH